MNKILRQITTIAILPLTIFLWILGWTLIIVADEKKDQKRRDHLENAKTDT